MDIRIFIRNIEDFLNNKIEKEFLDYKLEQLRKKILAKKEEASFGDKYSGFLILLEKINSELHKNIVDKELLFNYIGNLKEVDREMEKIENSANMEQDFTVKPRKILDRSELKTKKILLPEKLPDLSEDSVVEKLKEELKFMTVNSVNKLANIKLPDSPSFIKPKEGDCKTSESYSAIIKEDHKEIEKTMGLSGEDEASEVSPRILSSKKIMLPNRRGKYRTVEMLNNDALELKEIKSENVKNDDKKDFLSHENYDDLNNNFNLSKKTRFDITKILPDLKPEKQKFGKLKRTFEIFNSSMERSSGRKTSELEEPLDAEYEENIFHKSVKSSSSDEHKSEEFLMDKIDKSSNLAQRGIKNISYEKGLLEQIKSKQTEYSMEPFSTISSEDFNRKEPEYSEVIPVSSPLYSLLMGYEDLKGYRINLTEWISEQSEIIEQIKHLADKNNIAGLDEENIEKLEELASSAVSVLEDLKTASHEVLSDWDRREVYEATGRYHGQGIEDSEVKEIIDELRDFNIEIYGIIKNAIYSETSAQSDKNIELQIEEIPEEEYETQNYNLLKEKARDFVNKNILKEEFLAILNKSFEMVEETRERYHVLQVTEEEITMEVFKANQILLAGLEDWEQGLLFLKEYISSKNKDDISEGLKTIYEGNKKLVFMKYYAAHVRKQAERQSCQNQFGKGKKPGFS